MYGSLRAAVVLVMALAAVQPAHSAGEWLPPEDVDPASAVVDDPSVGTDALGTVFAVWLRDQAVVSASRNLVPMTKNEIVALAHRELGDYFPNTSHVKIERAHVVKELRATYSAVPGLEQNRPQTKTRHPNVFLAGDWTASGWPATMEGAVRSGYLAAEAVARAAGHEAQFLLP